MSDLAGFAPAMAWVAGPDGRRIHFNRPWLEFTGRGLDEERGLGWAQGVHAEDRQALLASCERAFAAREPFETEFRLRRHDGEYRWLFDQAVPVLERGTLQGFAGCCLDITSRAQAEDEFLAIVSHELRSPLNGIKSWTHVLESRLRDADPAIQRAIAGIMIGVEQQVRLIEGLLDVTRASRSGAKANWPASN